MNGSTIRWRTVLVGYAVVVGTLAPAYFYLDHGGVLADALEVSLPVVVSVALVAGIARRTSHGPVDARRAVTWCLGGVVVASLVGSWWAVVAVNEGLPVVSLGDELFALVNLGFVGGVLGATCRPQSRSRSHSPSHSAPHSRPRSDRDRDRCVAEVAWRSADGQDDVTAAVVRAIAAAEHNEPADLGFTLYEFVDPAVLEELANQEGPPWQFRFVVTGYEVRVSSHGTVSVYEQPRAV